MEDFTAEATKLGGVTRIFVNGQQSRSDNTYMDYYANAEAAVERNSRPL
jgi:hypothetical protein